MHVTSNHHWHDIGCILVPDIENKMTFKFMGVKRLPIFATNEHAFSSQKNRKYNNINKIYDNCWKIETRFFCRLGKS